MFRSTVGNSAFIRRNSLHQSKVHPEEDPDEVGGSLWKKTLYYDDNNDDLNDDHDDDDVMT